jgi:hypothetical protein
MEIEDIKSQLASPPDAATETKLKGKLLLTLSVLETSIVLYNREMKKIDPSVKITMSDIDKLQVIHAKVIREYLETKKEEKSIWERTKSVLGGPLAPMKDKIMKELKAQKIYVINDKVIKDLSKGAHAGQLWEKTAAALDTASQGRQALTKDELNAKVTKILEGHGLTEDQIAQIVRD